MGDRCQNCDQTGYALDKNGFCEPCRAQGKIDKETYRGYKVGELRKLFKRQANKENWKDPPKPFLTASRTQAEKMAAAFDFFLGGHEITTTPYSFLVTSKGYYHYIGV